MAEGNDSYRTCSTADCARLAAIDVGGCEKCRRYYCFQHVDSPEHTCDVCKPIIYNIPSLPTLWHDFVCLQDLPNIIQRSPLPSASRAKIEKDLVKDIQDKLRENGFISRIVRLTNDDKVHFGETVGISKHYIDFRIASSKDTISSAVDDEKKSTTPAEHLLMRVYRDDFSPILPKREMSAVLMLSNVASLDHLRHVAFTGMAPQYIQFCFEPFGILFIDTVAAGKGKPLSTLNPSGAQWQKIYFSLANFICDLDKPCSRLTAMKKTSPKVIEEICSLFRYLGEVQTRELWLEWTLATIGPFKSATEYYTTWADTLLRLIANRQIFNNFPDDAGLVFRYLKELAKKGRFNPFYPKHKELDTTGFYLKHSGSITEDKIIVDDEFNVIEIQDWAFARLVPGYEAFGHGAIKLRSQPYRNYGQKYGNEGNIDANEYIAATLEAKRRPDLARYFRIREKNICSLAIDMGAGRYQEHGEFLAAFKNILRIAGEIEEEKEEFCWEEWRGKQRALGGSFT